MPTVFAYILLFISLYFEIFMLVAFLRRRFTSVAPHPIDMSTLPSVAIVVPCFNESASLSATMQSLLALEYPPHLLEIIVVDDGSIDNTYEIAKTFEQSGPSMIRVRALHKDNGGKHTAMNLALAETNAEFIGCLDADSIVRSDALLKVMPVFENPKIAAVTPGIHVREPKTLLQHLQNVEYNLSVFNRFMLAGLGSVFITPGPFSFFRASVVRELGGWRYAHSTEDMEMALRMQESGYLIANAPKAVVLTSTPRGFRALFRQRVRWTYGWLRNAVDYRHMIGNGRYGNLGLVVLPSALISIATGIYFFCRTLFYAVISLHSEYERLVYGGIHAHPGFDAFFINTSAMMFLVYTSVALILVLITIGSLIGTGRRIPPYATPLFLLLYSFIVPLWLSAAVVRAIFKTGVKWR